MDEEELPLKESVELGVVVVVVVVVMVMVRVRAVEQMRVLVLH
jgi:hypothetical protein